MPPVVWKNIARLRGVAIALVVLNHATMETTGLIRGHLKGAGTFRQSDIWIEVILRTFTPVCLPMFLFAIGYFTFRFQKNWRSALASARATTIRYLLWAIPSYGILALLHRAVHPDEVLWGLFLGGPFPTYWFLVLLIQFSLVAPLLSRLVITWPVIALATAVLAQCMASAMCYMGADGIPVLNNSHSLLHNLPFLLLGMLASSRGDTVVAMLAPRRRWLFLGAGAFFVVTCAETLWLGPRQDDGTITSYVYDVDKVSFVSFALCTLGAFFTATPEQSWIRNKLDWLGVRSLALLLLVDPCIDAMLRLLWHADGLAHLSLTHSATPPVWMQGTWAVLPLFLVGLLAPLAAVEVTERRLGKRTKKFIFG